MLRKSEKLKKRKFLWCAPSLPSYYGSHFPTITLQIPSYYSIRHNGNLNACEWKTLLLRCAATVSLVVCTTPPFPTPYRLFPLHFLLRSGFLTWNPVCDFKDLSHQNFSLPQKLRLKTVKTQNWGYFIMSIELIRYQRDKNSGELYATPPNGKCPIVISFF